MGIINALDIRTIDGDVSWGRVMRTRYIASLQADDDGGMATGRGGAWDNSTGQQVMSKPRRWRARSMR